jgi:hypothetical protein
MSEQVKNNEKFIFSISPFPFFLFLVCIVCTMWTRGEYFSTGIQKVKNPRFFLNGASSFLTGLRQCGCFHLLFAHFS